MEIRENQLVKTFEEWGPEFHVEFDITILKLPPINNPDGTPHGGLVIFRIGNGDTRYGYGYGDLLPAMLLTGDGYVRITNTLHESLKDPIKFSSSTKHHVAIKQYQVGAGEQNIYYYVYVHNGTHGEIKQNAKNDAPKTYKHVMFYASDSWEGSPFTSEFGMIENMIVYQSMHCTMYYVILHK